MSELLFTGIFFLKQEIVKALDSVNTRIGEGFDLEFLKPSPPNTSPFANFLRRQWGLAQSSQSFFVKV